MRILHTQALGRLGLCSVMARTSEGDVLYSLKSLYWRQVLRMLYLRRMTPTTKLTLQRSAWTLTQRPTFPAWRQSPTSVAAQRRGVTVQAPSTVAATLAHTIRFVVLFWQKSRQTQTVSKEKEHTKGCQQVWTENIRNTLLQFRQIKDDARKNDRIRSRLSPAIKSFGQESHQKVLRSSCHHLSWLRAASTKSLSSPTTASSRRHFYSEGASSALCLAVKTMTHNTPRKQLVQARHTLSTFALVRIIIHTQKRHRRQQYLSILFSTNYFTRHVFVYTFLQQVWGYKNWETYDKLCNYQHWCINKHFHIKASDDLFWSVSRISNERKIKQEEYATHVYMFIKLCTLWALIAV